MITVNTGGTKLTEKYILSGKIQKKLRTAHDLLHGFDKSGGTGWVELPSEITKTELTTIKDYAKSIQDMCELFIVIGIGGSYAGANAGLEMLKKGNVKTEVIFLGTSFNAKEIQKALEQAKTKDVCVNVISKSGETTETAVTFHILEDFMKKKYKKGEYRKRIFVTTDYEKGSLREVATKEGYTSFVIPRTIGGRYSVFTPVGLLPLAVGGINIEKVIQGAKQAQGYCSELDVMQNPAYKYALTRYFIHTKCKKHLEVVASFDGRTKAFFEWFKQLFAESEGKDGKGLYVASLNYSTDLHSFGQFVQEGSPILFETIIDIKKQNADISLGKIKDSSPIAYLNGKSLVEIERATLNGVMEAHRQAGVPVVVIEMEEITEESFGEMLYFFMAACGMSAYLLGVNPFNQPGVEAYKQKTREILKQN